jgi:hypothetical protein
MEMVEDLVTYIVRFLVDNPDEVKVNKIEAEKTVILELKVAPSDVGKVIGKGGKTINAIRTLLSASATKCSKRTILEILD